MPMIDLTTIGVLPIAFGLVLARVSSFVVAAPMFGQGTVPNLVKMGLCVVLSVFWYPNYLEMAGELQGSKSALFVAGMSEIIAGFCIGYLVRLTMLPVRIAGTYVGQELGFSLGQVADPSSGAASNETGLLFDAMGLVLFWVTDVHHQSFRMLGYSTRAFQVDREFILEFSNTVTRLISQAHDLGLMIIGPLASVLFLLLVALSVMMRSWPQVTLFSFGSGARILIGLAALVLFTPAIVSNIVDVYDMVASSATDVFVAVP